MRKLMLALAGALLLPVIADAQVRASAGLSIDLPVVLPQLVVVQPGIRVVPECDHEVFYTNGYYWAREDNIWYRSRSHRGGWVVAPVRRVPAALVKNSARPLQALEAGEVSRRPAAARGARVLPRRRSTRPPGAITTATIATITITATETASTRASTSRGG